MTAAVALAIQLGRVAVLIAVATSPTTPGDCDLCAAPGPLHAVEGHRLCGGCLQARTVDVLDLIKALREELAP
jgi:hypothetical protein